MHGAPERALTEGDRSSLTIYGDDLALEAGASRLVWEGLGARLRLETAQLRACALTRGPLPPSGSQPFATVSASRGGLYALRQPAGGRTSSFTSAWSSSRPVGGTSSYEETLLSCSSGRAPRSGSAGRENLSHALSPQNAGGLRVIPRRGRRPTAC